MIILIASDSHSTIGQIHSNDIVASAGPSNILDNEEKFKLFWFGLIGYILLWASFITLSAGAYQLIIRWKLNMDTSRFEIYPLLIILVFFLIQIFSMIRDNEKKRATVGQIYKISISLILVIVLMISIPPIDIDMFYYSLANFIFGISAITMGYYFYRRSQGEFQKILKEISLKIIVED